MDQAIDLLCNLYMCIPIEVLFRFSAASFIWSWMDADPSTLWREQIYSSAG